MKIARTFSSLVILMRVKMFTVLTKTRRTRNHLAVPAKLQYGEQPIIDENLNGGRAVY